MMPPDMALALLGTGLGLIVGIAVGFSLGRKP